MCPPVTGQLSLQALRTVLFDEAEREALRDLGCRRAAEFDMRAVADQYRDAYLRLGREVGSG